MESANVKITFIPDGPAKVECDRAEIVKRDGTMIIKEHHFMLCRCGAGRGIIENLFPRKYKNLILLFTIF